MAKRKSKKKEEVATESRPGVKPTLAEQMAAWEAGPLAESLRKRPEVTSEFRTDSGIQVKRLYSPLDFSEADYAGKVGFPGQYPFTRGIEPSGYRTKESWLLNYYSGHGSPEDSNKLYKDLIAAEGGDIWIAMDLPTQIGLDSDHALAEGEVGKVGVALDTLKDMEILYEGIQVDRVKQGVVANSIGPWFLAMYVSMLEKRGLDPQKNYVWIQNDPFKEYTGRGTYIFPPAVALDLAADAVAYSCEHYPEVDPQYACTGQFRIGCNAGQEIGFGIAHLLTYIEAARRKGAPLEKLIPRLSLHGTTQDDFFEEIAKFRAARRLWARIVKDKFKTSDPRVLAIRQTTYTNTRLPARQPLNNVVRTTMHVLASLFAGVEHILAPAYDEALALPTLESTRLASLTKNILHCEFSVDQTVDPLGGSYFLETLTNEMGEKGWEWFNKIEKMGGPIAAIENGFYMRELGEGVFRYQKAIEGGSRTLIGVNKFNLKDQVSMKIHQPNPEAEGIQIERLQKTRKERDGARVEKCLGQIRKVAEEKAAGKESNIVPAMLDAVRAYASIGEIYGILREVFGEYKPWTTQF